MTDISDGCDYDFDYSEYDADKTKRSLRAHANNRANHMKAIDNVYRLAKAAPSQEAAAAMEEKFEAYKRTQKAIECGYEHLIELNGNDANTKAKDRAYDELAAERMDMEQKVLHVFGLCRPVAVPKPDKEEERTCKPNQALKPDELTATSKPTQFTAWLERFRTYYSSSRMRYASNEEQHQYLYACISSELRARIKPKVTGATPIFKHQTNAHLSLEEMLTQEFHTLYPLTTRRFEWLNQKMKSTWASYYARMQEFSSAADVSGMDPADFLAFALIIGTPDGEMKNEMLRLEHPTPDALDKIGQTYDRTGATKTQLATPSSPVKAFAAQAKGNQNTQGKNGPGVDKFRPDLVDKCKRCGAPLSDHSSKDCPKKRERCYLCKTVGHIAAVCIKSAAQAAQNSSQGASARALTQGQPAHATSQPQQQQQAYQGGQHSQPTYWSGSYPSRAPTPAPSQAFLPYSASSSAPNVEPRLNMLKANNAPTPHLGL